ncbi:MAG: NAD(P)-dependent oxidoreductase [Anaerolineales bacterium]|nr:NAD(P)-dependent oxidoreductase [Anaerolineales bacterium]
MQRVSVLGLGLMGTGIATNLLKAGFPLVVYNRTPASARPLLDLGARWAATPRAAAENADVVISVVADDTASRSVWVGDEGALAALPAGALAIECATLSLEWVQEWYAQVWARGLQAVDAPLFGSKGAAADGSVAVYVGAEPAAFEAARPVLRAFTGAATRIGPPTAGTVYKLINNMMSGVHLAVLGEAIALAERAGLDMEAVRAAISTGAASSPMVKGRLPLVAGRQYTDVHFALRWMHKDLNYALRLGEEFEVPLPTASAARELYRLALLRGLGDLDAAAEAEVVRGA